MTTVSAFRACAGGYVGATHVHPALLDAAREALAQAKEAELVADGYVARCGDDIGLVLLHEEAPGSASIASLVADVFGQAGRVGERLHQFGVNGGPHVDGAELSFGSRESEPVLCFFSDKAGAGSWNIHLYRMFVDPFNSPSLVNDQALRAGFRFATNTRVPRDNGSADVFDLPDDLYRFLSVGGSRGACVREVRTRSTNEVAAVASVGADPVMLVRCGSPFPGVEEVLEAFAIPYALGSSISGPSPLVPVSVNGDASSRSLGRAIGLGFQIAPGRLVGPRDLLGDAAFDDARREAVTAAEYLRRHGPFVPLRNGESVPH